ncbi:DUF6491 family protein [Sphingomonas sp. DT-204]|uniref:DUF6491 family protein n=1 Tax=Sphingomonas sp. DT-204 TaxID=3396166 RepID=UPI003F1B9F91
MRRCFLLLISALAACTGADGPRRGGRECFWASQVTGFGDAGPDRALVRVGARETWELTLSPGCPDVDWAMRIGIRSRAGERICPGRPAELLVPDASGLRSCLVRQVRKLTPEQAAAARNQAQKR